MKDLPAEALIELLKGLYQIAPPNTSWRERRLSPAQLVYDPRRQRPHRSHFREAKKVISEYKKATGNPVGTLELMLTYLERGYAFIVDFSDIDIPFYSTMCRSTCFTTLQKSCGNSPMAQSVPGTLPRPDGGNVPHS
ncbi:hypothetical protein [Chloroflexus sp.]|uniref:hypothetical protein n=1 Tax=Chloroflexus sp. TaxID=1904827 RepID=UPI002ACD4128|nr:hypothetical protein [Chloroflexus sp.]